ncbi:hypothetical protein HPB49_012531 [Dermacentor silvarum]|uniref:Uncharacterized protein n=1 Tax=Dermacentor silvarum TaxID=543639 RepID=A0ACB8C3N3_DERSI|nr:hypothetical protein HPB49_012531 [Dermacentor silvarum]
MPEDAPAPQRGGRGRLVEQSSRLSPGTKETPNEVTKGHDMTGQRTKPPAVTSMAGRIADTTHVVLEGIRSCAALAVILLSVSTLTAADFQSEKQCGVFFETRVINGMRASQGMFPWMVRLLVYLNGSSPATCGGAIITRWHILTAGHCVVRNHKLIPKIEGIYGAADTTSKYATKTRIAAVALHPRFSEDEYHDDIAVLRVPQAFNFGAQLRPVCLDFDLGDLTGKTVTVAGWGVQKSSRGPSDRLRYTKLQILQQSVCEQKLQSYKFNKSNMMCAYGEDTDACQGDSGSAVMFRKGPRYIQVGIVSHGVGCAQGMPGIYVPVSVYKEWILQTIADQTAFEPIGGQNMVR